MNTAIIAEYNPFHNGHALNIRRAREITGGENIIIIMSGSFVQRGEPAVFDKFTRTRHALMNGADMVLELPTVYSTGAADVFANGAAFILDKTNITDALFFGSEAGEIPVLEKIAEIYADEPREYKALIASYAKEGLSYPAARERAAASVLGMDLSGINTPNNILGIEYIAALRRINSKIVPYTMRREASSHNDDSLAGEISSGAAIRKAAISGSIPFEALPENIWPDFKNKKFPYLDGYSDIFCYLIASMKREELALIADMTEGLENRFVKCLACGSISDIIENVKTKRYTYTKLQRAALHTVLGISRDMQAQVPKYIRVLGVRREKKALLAELGKKAGLPVITSVKDNEGLLKDEIRMTDIYSLLTDKKTGAEYTAGMVVV